jgi:hypothetical protein
VIWTKLPTLPAGTLGELLRSQRKVVKEGFDAIDDYWLVFMPVLEIACGKAGRQGEAMVVIQGITKWNVFWSGRRLSGRCRFEWK